MTLTFFESIADLHRTEEVDDDSLIQLLEELEGAEFTFESQRKRFKSLLESSLDGDDEAFEAFLNETAGLVAEDTTRQEQELSLIHI